MRGSGLSNLIKGGILFAAGVGIWVFAISAGGSGGRHAIGLPLMALGMAVIGAIMFAVGCFKMFTK